ncbi:type VII secretion protein EccB [Gordonia aichiensis]|uniref:type VII secretion protein EccB n=1 Tax=Gordonia aichiensis TaxID=36820 RepID=UPI0032677BBE
MSRHLTTRAHVSGYRFGVARAEHALVRRDVGMVHDPMRTQFRSLIAGVVVAVLAVAGAGVYGFIRPQPSVRDAQIVAADDGGLYVLLDEVMHPVPNVASARLILGTAAPVRRAADRSLAAYPRGAAVGIPGAPDSLAGPGAPGRSVWSVCDGPDGTAVVAGDLGTGGDGTGERATMLVEHSGVQWLIYPAPGPGGGTPVRARVDRSRIELLRALAIDDAVARSVSAGLLNSLPARPDLRVPEVAGRGAPGALGLPIGAVIASAGVDGVDRFHLVLADGVQPLSGPAAETMHLVDSTAPPRVRRVSAAALAAVPARTQVPLGDFPQAVPRLSDRPAPVVCHRWSHRAEGRPATSTLVTAPQLPLPDGARAVTLASADGLGPGLDQVYLRPRTGEHVVLTGIEPDSSRAGAAFYISDAGVRYQLAGADTGAVLGLGRPVRAPWPMIALLPAGTELSREAAASTRDALVAGPEPGNR